MSQTRRLTEELVLLATRDVADAGPLPGFNYFSEVDYDRPRGREVCREIAHHSDIRPRSAHAGFVLCLAGAGKAQFYREGGRWSLE